MQKIGVSCWERLRCQRQEMLTSAPKYWFIVNLLPRSGATCVEHMCATHSAGRSMSLFYVCVHTHSGSSFPIPRSKRRVYSSHGALPNGRSCFSAENECQQQLKFQRGPIIWRVETEAALPHAACCYFADFSRRGVTDSLHRTPCSNPAGFSSRCCVLHAAVFYPRRRRRGGPVHILWYLNWRARNERCCFLSIKFLVFALAPTVAAVRVLYYYLVYCSACSFVTCLFCFHFSHRAFKFVKCLSDE